jgi:hypothetical protein
VSIPTAHGRQTAASDARRAKTTTRDEKTPLTCDWLPSWAGALWIGSASAQTNSCLAQFPPGTNAWRSQVNFSKACCNIRKEESVAMIFAPFLPAFGEIHNESSQRFDK